MLTRLFLKIWWLCVNFENVYKLVEGPITVERLKCCDWSQYKLVERNFSKLMHSNQIFRKDFVCIQYHLCKISPEIMECKF